MSNRICLIGRSSVRRLLLRRLFLLFAISAAITGVPFDRESSAAILLQYDSGAGTPLSPTTQGWIPSEIIEATPPALTLAEAVDTSGNPALANAGLGATGWIIRDYLDGAANGQDDRPEYNQPLTMGNFSMMQSNGWSFTANFKMNNDTNFNQEMRVLSMDQGGGDGLPFDIKVNATYVGDSPGGNLGLSILGGSGEVDTGFPAEQFNTVIFADADGDGSFTIDVNGNLLDGGSVFTSNPSSGDVPGDDILVFGANSTGGDGGGIEYDFLRLEAGDAAVTVGLMIDRGTGQILLANNSADARSIVGYKLASLAGALNPGDWLSISDNYDSSAGGPVDNNDEWIELTNSASRSDLSEFEPDGDGGELSVGQSIDFGNAWIKNPTEDVTAELLLLDGTVENVVVTFAGGPNDAAYQFGDLDFDGDFDEVDFRSRFVPGFGADTSALSQAEQYQAGDFNRDNLVDEIDFLILNNAFLAANPGAAALSFASIPEPTSLALLALGAMMCCARRGIPTRRLGAVVMVAIACVSFHSPFALAQSANLLAHWSFDETSGASLADSTGNHNATGQGGLTGSANPSLIGNAWNFAGGFADVANPEVFTSLDASYSFSMWFKTTNDGPAVMWSISDSTAGSEEVLVRINDFAPEGTPGGVHYMGRPNVSGAVSAARMDDDQWHHVVATQSPSGWQLFIDGALDKSGPEVHSPLAIDADTVGIGRNVDSGGGQWTYTGLLDDLSIWDGSLTANDVGNLFLKGLNGVAAPDPFTAQLSLDVSTTSGEVTLKNDAVISFDIDLYRIISADNSLNAGGWNSLEDQGFDSNAWTQLGNGNDKVSEGAFGDSTDLTQGFAQSLGTLYNLGIDARDLVLEYHLAGTPAEVFLEGVVDYVETPGLTGDYNGNGVVDAADYTVWRDAVGTSGPLPNDPLGGTIGAAQYDQWKANYGNTLVGTASQAVAVPEPSSGLLILVGVTLAGLLSVRGRGSIRFVAPLLSMLVLATSVSAATNDREYLLGDDVAENAQAGNQVGSAVGGVTFDSQGTVGAGDLQDLVVNGAPQYVSVSDRPGASPGDLGASFNGTNDSLLTSISMNQPAQMWDNEAFFPPPDQFPHNYEGILSHGMQLWAKPNPSGLGQNTRQDLIFDTLEHGVFITENDTWGLWYDPDEGGLATLPQIDSGVSVTSTLDGNGWAHVMQIAGFEDPIGGGTTQNGALLINGVAVAAKAGGYDADASALVVGASPDEMGDPVHHFPGVLDDVRLFFWGDNSDEDSGDGRLGQDWGPLNLAEDNDWIAQRLQELGVTHPADVNLDGIVSGDGSGPSATDDVTIFVENWLFARSVNEVQVGDWISRQNGDLNYDGIVDLTDAFMLRSGLTSSGLGSFNLSLLPGIGIPEPTTLWLALFGGLVAIVGLRFDRTN